MTKGEKIKLLRERAGMSQVELAEMGSHDRPRQTETLPIISTTDHDRARQKMLYICNIKRAPPEETETDGAKKR